MAIRFTADQLSLLARWHRSGEFALNERNYKRAVHLFLGSVLRPPLIDDDAFPALLVKVLAGEATPNDVGLSKEDARFYEAWRTEEKGNLRKSMINLCGGGFGVPQLTWMPRAVEHDLGRPLQEAFQQLVTAAATDATLATGIDSFRTQMKSVQQELRRRGGFRPGWRVLAPTYPFIGMLMAAFDPKRFTFYSAGKLRTALQGVGAHWPRASGGASYVAVCSLVREACDALETAGISVGDLIDTQGLLYMLGSKREVPMTPSRTAAAREVRDDDPADTLARTILWPTESARRLLEVARRGKPLLFSGPPGTGKTFVARAAARAIALDDDHIEVVQFHPSYAYEDFMEGIRPLIGDQDGTIRYEIRPGVLRRVADDALADPESTFVLIIDEINRANLPRVLGEVLYCVEYRGKDGAIHLPYSGEDFVLPENVLIIGTMNTADRSIALVDAALRRRFLELSFPPNLDVLRRWWSEQNNAALGEDAAARLERLNAELRSRLDPHRLIGQTYLMDLHIAEEGFEPVWDWQLKPVLEEHLYAHPDDVDQLRKVFLRE
jgi:MoxR-like ATPase